MTVKAGSRPRRRWRWRAIGLGAAALGLWSAVTDTRERHGLNDEDDTRLVALYVNSADPQRAADFYAKVFGATPLAGPEPQASLLGGATAGSARVRTTGYRGQGPVLSFLHRPDARNAPLAPQDPGYAHICFEADDVAAVVAAIQAQGGRVLSRFAQPLRSPVVYATDPDGNALEVHVPLPTPLTPGTLLRSLAALARSVLLMGGDAAVRPSRFLHVNINSPDWQRAVGSYETAGLGQPTGWQRAYDGDYVGDLTGVVGARVHGRHVALRGYATGGPTLEVFTYLARAGTQRLALEDAGRIAIGFEARQPAALAARLAAAGFRAERADGDRSLWRDGDGNRFLFIGSP